MVNMQHFSYSHLRPDLAVISQMFHEAAHAVMNTLPMNAERTTCLRKLLEAKDCAVRAYLEGGQPAVVPPAPSDGLAVEAAVSRPSPAAGEKRSEVLAAGAGRAEAEAGAKRQMLAADAKLQAEAIEIKTAKSAQRRPATPGGNKEFKQ